MSSRPKARTVARDLVINNLPGILDGVFAALQEPHAFAAVEALDPHAAREHGRSRAELGYSLEELGEEYNSLREVLLERLDASGVKVDNEHARALHSALDRAHREGVGCFIDLQQQLLRSRQSDFLARLAHDFRTPLATILSSTQLLLRDAQPADAALLLRSERAARRILLLVENQLATETALAGRLLPRIATFAVDEVLAQAVELVRLRAEAKSIALRLDVPPQLHWSSDGSLVGQVVQNLVDNAIKYTESGSVTVTCRREGDAILIAVEDTGRGISKEMLPHVFDMYERAEYRSQGRGVGLAVVKEITRALAGSIDVESHEGSGSRFTVRLPALSTNRRETERRAATAMH